MTGRRALLGLSLLCALTVCAIVASSSSAEDNKGTTAFLCAEVKEPSTGDFEDKHCFKSHPKKEGAYTHEAIAVGTKTAIEGVDPDKSTIANATIGGVKAGITCKETLTTGTWTNEEPKAGKHTLTGTGIDIVFSKCTASYKTESCPITKFEITNAKSMDVEAQQLSYETNNVKTTNKYAMGIKFEPTTGTKLGELTADKTCPGGEKTYNVEGAFMALPAGAELISLIETTEPTLKIGGQPAFFIGSLTTQTTEGATPVSVTTTDKLS